MLQKGSFHIIDIILVLLNIFIILCVILLYIHSHTSSDCRGHIVSKVRNVNGSMLTREAKLSVHDANHTSEIKKFISEV